MQTAAKKVSIRNKEKNPSQQESSNTSTQATQMPGILHAWHENIHENIHEVLIHTKQISKLSLCSGQTVGADGI